MAESSLAALGGLCRSAADEIGGLLAGSARAA